MLEKISLAIPVHAIALRATNVIALLDFAESEERIAEVVLSLEPDSAHVRPSRPKSRVFVNDKREFVFRNKFLAIEKCRCEWAIIFDSDNMLDKSYLDAVYKNRGT
jgi:hypothetical protein